MASSDLPASPLYDLLVVLGTSRFGTDWPNVSASIKAALVPLEARDPGCTEPPSAAECEERFRALVEEGASAYVENIDELVAAGIPAALPEGLADVVQAFTPEEVGSCRKTTVCL